MISAKKITASLLTGFLMISSIQVFAAEPPKPNNQSGSQIVENAGPKSDTYSVYIQKYANTPMSADEISIKASDFASENNSGVKVTNYEGRNNVLYWDSQQGCVEWKINAPKAGLYNIGLEYCPIPLKNNDIEMALYIDGKLPFSEAGSFMLLRTWKNETNEFKEDSRGNQIRPRQLEVFNWTAVPVHDPNGKYNDPFEFYLSAGEHSIRLELLSETVALSQIKLYQVSAQKPYKAPANAPQNTGFLKPFQAEAAELKSSATLYPTEEKGDPAIQPSDTYKIRYNTIGKNTFIYPGQWISWKFDVPEDGYYNIALKVRQNVQRGMYSTRRIYIDGEVPFSELNNVKFPYSINWYTEVLGGSEPYLFNLKKGTHEIKMEIVTGDTAGPLRELENIVYELNLWYRKIIMITGSNPDIYRKTIDTNRDFLLDQKIPGLMEGFKDISDRLTKIKNMIDGLSLGNGNTASFIDEVVAQLKSFIKEPETIPKRLDNYKGNVSSLASLVLQMREQPLEIDYFTVYSPDMAKKLPAAKANIFETLAFRTRMFFSTFSKDYNSVGKVYNGDPLNVWVSTSDIAMTGISSGRDQVQLVKSLVDDLFVPNSKIGVNISLVDSSTTLTQAVLAGKGPDAALFISKEAPVNLAIRGALADLTQFSDFNDVKSRFYESAMIPYYFNGKCYALPETQSYDMMFYRSDIFDELGLKPPKTWDEFYSLLAVLQKNNMMVGIPESQRIFEMMLYQNDGSFYNDKLTKTGFDSPEALTAFKGWTGLYSKYSLPLVFDFFNRFRTGEMPIAIMPYTQSNYLMAAAPELKNLWQMAPVPGTVNGNGAINNTETSYGTGCIVLAGSGKEKEAYEFIKWWTSGEVQSRFGNEIEQLLGPSGRYPAANKEAFDYLPWNRAQAENLKAQWRAVTDVPQVPGNYYITRNISFAFRNVVYNFKNERETLNKYNKEVNKEIQRKLLEFGFDTE